MKSIKSVYKIGNGPSSSHTVGPYHAAQVFGARYPQADAFRVTLYGSLAFTGEGHGTGKAIKAGLPGTEVVFNREETDLPHPNTMLFEAFKDDPEVTVIENVHYLEGNNITSMYAAKDFLPGSFVLEGDIIISNDEILRPEIEKSGYCANYLEEAPEWALKVENGRIMSCEIKGAPDAYRLWGISMWTREDGERLSELVRAQIEDIKDWNVYWDELALFKYKEQFDLGIREIGENDIIEIDTFEELVEMDPSYEKFRREK